MRRSWLVLGVGLAAVVLQVAASSGLGAGPRGSQPPPRLGSPPPQSLPAPAPPPPPPSPGDPLRGLIASERARFNVGLQQFVEVETPAGGLGPVFNDSSCVACHSAAGTGGAGTRLVTRFGRLVDGQYDPMVEYGGPLIQSQGIGLFNGVDFVAEVVPPQATIVAHRRTTPLFGLGLVDAIPDETLLMLAEHQAATTPATAGRASLAVDPATGENSVGRFGWKAQHATLFAFAGDAYLNELGVTTPLLPAENCPQGHCALLAANPAQTNPNDVDNSSIQALADFLMFLAPAPPASGTTSTATGQSLFAAIGCADCHQPAFQTGPNAVAALSNVTFRPYSDFLLHDMGSLGDGIVQNTAGPTEFRTPPLWGLRLQPSLLHDGRTSSVASAILLHDGQGRAARNRYANLNRSQQAQLIAFLNSL